MDEDIFTKIHTKNSLFPNYRSVSHLQFIIIVATVVFLLFGIDLYKRKKMNLLHVLVFFLWWGMLILFSININLLNKFWSFFGVNRWAEVLVYIGIIILFYLYIDLLNKHTKDKYELTRLISQNAINKTFLANKDHYQSRKNTKNNHDDTINKDEICFLMRIYNEAETLETVVDEIFEQGYRKIVFINDGSMDNTREVLDKIKSKYPNKLITILQHDINRWGGAANKTLFNYIKQHGQYLQAKWFITYDADGQMNIQDMQTFEDNMIKHPDYNIFYGSRFISGASTETMPFSRKVILLIAKIVTFVFYGSTLTDPHNGYRAINIKTFKELHILSDGMHYANELVEQIKLNKRKYKEVATNTIYTDHSLHKAHAQKNFQSIRLGLEMIYKKLFFR